MTKNSRPRQAYRLWAGGWGTYYAIVDFPCKALFLPPNNRHSRLAQELRLRVLVEVRVSSLIVLPESWSAIH